MLVLSLQNYEKQKHNLASVLFMINYIYFNLTNYIIVIPPTLPFNVEFTEAKLTDCKIC